MKKGATWLEMGVRILLFALLLMVLSPGVIEVSGQEVPLTVDVWTDRGGQGEDIDGGAYQVGEEITIYVRVSTGCQIGWVLSGPSGGDLGEERVDPGIHPLLRKVAEEADVGKWEMALGAQVKEQQVFDMVSFSVVEAGVVSPEPTESCSEIVGKWRWFTGGVVTISSDGTMREDLSGNPGRWECTDPVRREFVLRWDRGGWVDTLVLSEDGERLEGTNNAGMSVSGQRLKPSTEPSAPTGAMLEDNFDSENQGQGTLNYSGFANWDVTEGSIDLIGHGFWDFFPDHGLYLDLDGSSNNAGRLESKTTFRLESGNYRLEFDLAGSPLSGPDTVTVSLGDLYREDFTLNQNEPFSRISREISVPRSTNTRLIFDHAGQDNQGLLLDNVKLTKLSAEIPREEVGMLDLSEAPEEWVRKWTVLRTLENFAGGGKPGFYPQGVRSGHANPNPGREGILYLHPKNQEEPALIKRDLTLTGAKPTLKMGVSGNRDVDGDWALVVQVNGEPLEEAKIIAGSQGWQDLSFDLSAYSGETITIEVEARANNWYYEYAFFDYIRVEDKTPEPGVGVLPTPTPLIEGLVAYWKFDEGTGNTTYDSSDYANHGSIQGASWTSGRFGAALSFDGKDDYVRVPWSPSLDTKNEITLEAWINPQEGNSHPILEYNDGTRFGVHVWQWRRWPDLYANLVNTQGHQPLEAPEIMSSGWQHIAVTYDGTSGVLYRNGELVAITKVKWLTLQTAYDFYIGSRPSEGRYFKGLIDEVRIYNRGLSQAEIKADMKATPPVVQPPPRLTPYKDAFRLSTGELIIGELLSFDGTTFTIRTDEGVIEKKREEVVNVSLGVAP